MHINAKQDLWPDWHKPVGSGGMACLHSRLNKTVQTLLADKVRSICKVFSPTPGT